ncbi:hypothetical protein Y1Q_0001355 [Alligator mississippiensis]|uniref:Uncharacterized protein n=1 Tax=Alligator mississippiensis TaxID=8496 RepID=A0A151M956_ALLMI|nr:hypothetical protein Y1Q_0001355 [Alligator mississippiensis]
MNQPPLLGTKVTSEQTVAAQLVLPEPVELSADLKALHRAKLPGAPVGGRTVIIIGSLGYTEGLMDSNGPKWHIQWDVKWRYPEPAAQSLPTSGTSSYPIQLPIDKDAV